MVVYEQVWAKELNSCTVYNGEDTPNFRFGVELPFLLITRFACTYRKVTETLLRGDDYTNIFTGARIFFAKTVGQKIDLVYFLSFNFSVFPIFSLLFQ